MLYGGVEVCIFSTVKFFRVIQVGVAGGVSQSACLAGCNKIFQLILTAALFDNAFHIAGEIVIGNFQRRVHLLNARGA